MQTDLPIPVIELQVVIRASPQTVWHVLTAPEQIEQWLGTQVKSEWKTGAPIGFAFTWEGKSFEDKGRILRFEPLQAFSYSYWSGLSGLPDEPANYSIVSFAIAPAGGSVRLELRHDHLPSQAMYEHTRANWVETLGTIKALAESAGPEPSEKR
jgi:uncharacterized protein YndB with AHSA1/START domain